MVQDLVDLLALAQDELLPRIAARDDALVIAPVFNGSRHVAADGDLVSGRTLIEIKTNVVLGVGERRYPRLDRSTIRQVLGYVLHDTSDEYKLTKVAIYQARYGYYAEWDLNHFLEFIAGVPVDLADLREQYALLLSRGPDAPCVYPCF